MGRNLAWGALLSVAIILAASAAHAGPGDDVVTARAHFERGQRHYEVGSYREALEEFRAAHAASPDTAYLFNVAQCLRNLGEGREALQIYRRFLKLAPLDSPARPQAEKHVRELEAGVAKEAAVGAVAPSVVPPAAPVAPSVEQGRASPGAEPKAGDERTAARSTGSLRWLPWVTGAAAVLLAGGATVAGLSARSRYESLLGGCGQTSGGCGENEINGVESRGRLANILWMGAGIAAIGTGLAVYAGRGEAGLSVATRF